MEEAIDEKNQSGPVLRKKITTGTSNAENIIVKNDVQSFCIAPMFPEGPFKKSFPRHEWQHSTQQ